jgi:hypothetical protein
MPAEAEIIRAGRYQEEAPWQTQRPITSRLDVLGAVPGDNDLATRRAGQPMVMNNSGNAIDLAAPGG